jgi:hypothetical protein
MWLQSYQCRPDHDLPYRLALGKGIAMKRSHLSGVLLGIMLAAIMAQTALADRPARDPAPPPPGTVISLTSGECPFPVDLLVVANKEYTLTFASGAQIVTGQLSVRATNVTTGSSVDLSVSGPLFTSVGGSTLQLSGSSLLFLPAGATGANSPGVLWLTRGPVLIDLSGQFLAFRLIAADSSVTDICAALAGT